MSVPNFSETEECQSSLMALLFETVGNNELGRHFGKCYCVNNYHYQNFQEQFENWWT